MDTVTQNKQPLAAARRVLLLALIQVLIALLGLALLYIAWTCPGVRDAEGNLEGTFCLPLSLGLAAILTARLLHTAWVKPGLWFALAMSGQAAALQLINAGHDIHYQHYLPIDRMWVGDGRLAVVCIVVQVVFVIAAMIREAGRIRAWVSQTFKPWQVLGLVGVLVLCSATISAELPNYVIELFIAGFIQSITLCNIYLLARSIPQPLTSKLHERFNRWLGASSPQDSPQPGGIDRFVLVAAAWVVVVAAGLSIWCYQQHPHVQDEVIYLYQARYFASGMMTTLAPPVPQAFSIYMIPHESAQWYSIFSPGWPAVLAIGVMLGVPWLVNPVLGGLGILLSYLFVREISTRRQARLVVLLMCVSPWYVFMAMSYMSHTFTLVCALTGALGISWARRTGHSYWGWVAGAATGVVSLIRPLDGVALAAMLGLWAIGLGGKRIKVSAIAGLVIATVLVGAVIFPYNKRITGDYTKPPLMSYYEQYFGPKANALGFGPGRGLDWPLDAFPGHSPLEAVINANLNITVTNTELFGWGTGSLILLAIVVFARKWETIDRAMLAAIAVVIGLYSLYWFSGGPDFGARYWYLAFIPLIILTARAVHRLPVMIVYSKLVDPSMVEPRVMAALTAVCLLSLINFFPWRTLDKYYHYLGMRPGIAQLAEKHDLGSSLVLIRGNAHPDYESAWAYNPLDLQSSEPVFAWDKDPQVRSEVIDAYADRPIWIVNGPSITQRGYEVTAGPLSAQDALAFPD